MVWPHAHGDWANSLAAIERVYCQLIQHISRFEKLLIIYYDDTHLQHIKSLLSLQSQQRTKLIWHQAHSNDIWVRDFGPITTTCGQQLTLLNFRFNGWGNKYPYHLDNLITQHLYDNGCFADKNLETINFILEGGSIDCDGHGNLLTTSTCLLTASRNPKHDKPSIEALLSRTLGVKRILWLHHGEICGDDTDGHIDMLARFCSEDTIAYSYCDDPKNNNYLSLQAMQKELQKFKRNNGLHYQLIPLPLPKDIFDTQGRHLPASYANFLIINDAVLVPVYNDPADSIALQRLSDGFPGREIIAIDCLPLIQQNGSLHCVTMQLPEGLLPEN